MNWKRILAVIFIQGGLFAQQPVFEMGLWKQQSVKGSLVLEGIYRSQRNTLQSGKTEQPLTKSITGAFNLDSRSYLWHPNFLKLNILLTYNPTIQNEQFLVIPNRSETRTAEQLRVQSHFFSRRPLSLNAFVDLSRNFTNRDYTGRVEGIKKDFGMGLSFRNAYLPFTVNYIRSDLNQKEIEAGRQFKNLRRNLRAEFSKSFAKRDIHRISYSFDEYRRAYGAAAETHNSANALRIQNTVSWEKERPKNWNSLIFYRVQQGTQAYDRLQVNERISIALPAQLKFSGIYNFLSYRQEVYKTKQNNVHTRLEHQLYNSLHSRVFYEYITLDHTSYNESARQGGMALDYKKKIPGGVLHLSYEKRLRKEQRNSEPSTLHIIREKHILDDSNNILLDNPNIAIQSILVRDESSGIIYQENMDYILIQRGNFVEIQRLPGGQIQNGQTVYVDYSAERALSFRFNSNTNIFHIRLNVFNRIFEPYFRLYQRDYDHVRKEDHKILKTALQRVFGLRISKSFISGGLEFDSYDSNLMPYRSWRYYINISKDLSNKLNLFIRGNRKKFTSLSKNEEQQFTDISGRIIYLIGMNSRLSMNGGYRLQQGRGLDLDLLNFRMEFSSRFRAVYLRTGLELYRRNFSGEKINYNGAYIKIERKF